MTSVFIQSTPILSMLPGGSSHLFVQVHDHGSLLLRCMMLLLMVMVGVGVGVVVTWVQHSWGQVGRMECSGLL